MTIRDEAFREIKHGGQGDRFGRTWRKMLNKDRAVKEKQTEEERAELKT